MPLGPAYRNTATAKLPPSGTEAVFKLFADAIRHGKGLGSATVLDWTNPTADVSLPSGEGPPWVRITPRPGPSAVYCRTPRGVTHRMPMTVDVETSVAGSDVAASMRLWELILYSIFPTPPSFRAGGISRIECTKPGWGPHAPESNRCEGMGQFALLLHYTTPE